MENRLTSARGSTGGADQAGRNGINHSSGHRLEGVGVRFQFWADHVHAAARAAGSVLQPSSGGGETSLACSTEVLMSRQVVIMNRAAVIIKATLRGTLTEAGAFYPQSQSL